MSELDDEALLRECEELLAGINVPDPFNLAEFVAQVGRRLGRPIRLAPFTDEVAALLAGSDVTAVLVPWKRYAVLCFRPDALEWSQEIAIFHEIAHALCHHRSLDYPGEEALRSLMEQLASSADPDCDPDRVGQVLARHGYDHPQERKAELVASLLASRVRRRTRSTAPPTLPAEDAVALNRLARALGHRPPSA